MESLELPGMHIHSEYLLEGGYPLVMTNSLLLQIGQLEIVDIATKNGDFSQLCKRLPEGL